MNWEVWSRIEIVLDRFDIRPILAVVPDNHDQNLMVASVEPNFWGKVRQWQEKGYGIALHGYQHEYVNNNAGIMGLTRKSEFAGLPYAAQLEKLEKAIAIFNKHKIRPDAWIAPSHSFDRATLMALDKVGLRTISDGLWPFPFTDKNGLFWVPQQLWGFRDKPSGVWTVCLHHNNWEEERISKFESDIALYANRITNLSAVHAHFANRRQTMKDKLVALVDFIWNHRLINLRHKVFDCRHAFYNFLYPQNFPTRR